MYRMVDMSSNKNEVAQFRIKEDSIEIIIGNKIVNIDDLDSLFINVNENIILFNRYYSNSTNFLFESEDLFLKIYKNLGFNAEIYFSSLLNKQAVFNNYPKVVASINDPLNDRILGLITKKIKSSISLWDKISSFTEADFHLEIISWVEKIGILTAQMHYGLSMSGLKYFSLSDVIKHRKLINIDPEVHLLSHNLPLINTHGDYHLGQVLIDESLNSYVIDFEGEPLNLIDQEEKKDFMFPIYKDIAGMLRSFSYAYCYKFKAVNFEFEKNVLDTFIASYSEAISNFDNIIKNIVIDKEILNLFIKEKLFYEIEYERTHRPDYLWIPELMLNKINAI